MVSNTTGNNQWDNCISLDYIFVDPVSHELHEIKKPMINNDFIIVYYFYFSVLNIVIGVLLDAMEMPLWVVYVVVAYAAYQILFELFLEIYDCAASGKGKYIYNKLLKLIHHGLYM